LGFLHLDEENDMLIIVDSQRYVSVCRWKSLPPDSEPPFQIEFETNALSQVNQNSTAAVTGAGRVGVPFATNAVASYTEYTVLKSSLLFAYEPKSRWLISCGHWDHSVRITGIDERCSFFLYKIIYFHRDVVTCIGLTENGNYLVTGSTDNTVAVCYCVSVSYIHPLILCCRYGK
jgi:WD40 repeat protein